MSEKTVLLIDDSATIRRLVDSELSAAGYRVLLAPTAEEGLEQAVSERPDLIILDHQLPGTTGYEVCCQLLADPTTAKIPVVASSTLRKKAYSEYVDCDNVVDMLPKPYSAEVLIATIESAIDTAAMVVQSQSSGSAMPEVINALGESDLTGTFECFSLREVIDLINNGKKSGVLEFVTQGFRVYVYTDGGRIQAVTASGINPDLIAASMPDNLAEMAPVVKFTVTGKRGAQVDGLVELLDNKVLDPRLLRRLLRIQAATLLKMCFDAKPISFRFDRNQAAPSLFQRLPLDISLVALLVEGAVNCDQELLPELMDNVGFVRKAIRGQSLDRAGLSSKHMQLMKFVAEPATVQQIGKQLQWDEDETVRVLHGFEMADLVEQTSVHNRTIIYCVSPDATFKQKISALFSDRGKDVLFTAVSDMLALGLLLRRQRPEVVLVDIPDNTSPDRFHSLKLSKGKELADVTMVAACSDLQKFDHQQLASHGFDFALSRNADANEFLDRLLGKRTATVPPVSTDGRLLECSVTVG